MPADPDNKLVKRRVGWNKMLAPSKIRNAEGKDMLQLQQTMETYLAPEDVRALLLPPSDEQRGEKIFDSDPPVTRLHITSELLLTLRRVELSLAVKREIGRTQMARVGNFQERNFRAGEPPWHVRLASSLPPTLDGSWLEALLGHGGRMKVEGTLEGTWHVTDGDGFHVDFEHGDITDKLSVRLYDCDALECVPPSYPNGRVEKCVEDDPLTDCLRSTGNSRAEKIVDASASWHRCSFTSGSFAVPQ